MGCQLRPQPALRQVPVPADRLLGNLQYLGGFLYAQAAEEAQLDDLALPRIELRQSFQSVVDRDQIVAGCPRRHRQIILKLQRGNVAASFLSLARTRDRKSTRLN